MFKLQIVTPEGDVVRFPAGGPLEKELVDTIVEAALAKGVGLFKTQAHVAEDLRAAVTETIYALKADTRFVVR